MTPVKWYKLYVSGSLDSSYMYVRRFSEELQRSGEKSLPPATPALSSVISNPGMSKNISAHCGIKKKRRKIKKVIKTDPINACPVAKIKPPIVPDTPKMVEFFGEVRQRELRDYYLRMKAAERYSRVPAV